LSYNLVNRFGFYTMPRIICQRTDNHWSAYFADSPETAFGGEWPAEAIERLAATVPGLDVERLTADHEQPSDDRLVFVLELGVCLECSGSGEYAGLSAVEVCGAVVGAEGRDGNILFHSNGRTAGEAIVENW
jgi:hypothetical protein